MKPEQRAEIVRVFKRFMPERADEVFAAGGTACRKYVLKTGSGKYLLRRRRPEFSAPGTVKFDHSVIRRLSEKGLPVAPPLQTAGMKRGAVFQDGRAYELFPFIEGLETFSGGMEQVSSAGATLGRMHRALAGFVPEGRKPWRREFLPAFIKGQLEAEARRAPGFSGKKRSILKKLEDELDRLIENYPCRGLRRTIIHGDYTSANLMFGGNRAGGLFDFDWSMREDAVYDISRGVVFFCFGRSRPLCHEDIRSLVGACEISPGRISVFTDAYRSEFDFPEADARALPLSLKEYFIGSRVRAMRKVPEGERALLADESLIGMLESVDGQSRALIEACL